MTTHMFLLMERHARIDGALRKEQGRRFPDPFKLRTLKKMKLALKDRLQRLSLPKMETR